MSRQPDQNWLAICHTMHGLDLINNSRDIARFSSGCLLKYRYAVLRDSLVQHFEKCKFNLGAMSKVNIVAAVE